MLQKGSQNKQEMGKVWTITKGCITIAMIFCYLNLSMLPQYWAPMTVLMRT